MKGRNYMSNNLEINKAVRWSSTAELMSKLVSPITSMLLARLLTPEAFGLIASITMVTSFSDLFTDGGCNKFIIQHTFTDEQDLRRHATVGFWLNLTISTIIWLFIVCFRANIAKIIGISGFENALVVAALSLFMTAFSSMHMALLRKKLDFKHLFKIRTAATVINLVVSVVLAFWGAGVWAVIFGTLCRDFTYALLFNLRPIWKPNFFFDFSILKNMFSFSGFTLLETLMTWFKSNAAILILSGVFTPFYLGLYKTPITIDNSIIGLLYSALIPVLYSGLSKVKNQKKEFENLLFRIQRLMAMIAFPMAMVMLVYSDIVTRILLGSQWLEVSWFVGLYGCAIVVENVFCIFGVEAYRAKEKPLVSALSIAVNNCILCISIYTCAVYGFKIVCYVTVINSLIYYIVQMGIMRFVLKISPWGMLKNVFPYLGLSFLVGIVSYTIKRSMVSMDSMLTLLLMSASIITYTGIILLGTKSRSEIVAFVKN